MFKNITVILLMLSFSLFGLDWYRSYEDGIKEAEKLEKPILFLYISPKQKESLKLSYVISQGELDCLADKFIMVQLNVTTKENSERLKSYKITDIPMFILQDFNPKRKLSVKVVYIQPANVFNGLYEIYYTLGTQLWKLGDIEGAKDAFDLISGIPNELGKNVTNTLKEIEKIEGKSKAPSKEDDMKKAQSYFDQAKLNIDNGNFDKGYLYLMKVVDLAPKTELEKKAQEEMEKISDLVDKSKFVKKKDTKGSKK
ncbi:MAG: hypothetical protein JXR69_04370 [Candidatus Delongbacteria bacterium]|nr:hypothetical protein [Candidatus Delongbacteria bacterium]